MSSTILIVAGEASGDLHGAHLIQALKKKDPSLVFYGIGGEKMKAQGLKTVADARNLAVVGITEVFLKLGKIFGAFRKLKKKLDEDRPDIVILIDFPDFNLRVAREAKKRGIPVVYYISPQVWAWRRGRVKTIAARVSKMLVVFPFEKEFYENAGVDVTYVGHPLSSTVSCELSKSEALSHLGMHQAPTVALLPGSRRHEVERLLPAMLDAAAMIRNEMRDVQFVLPLADTIEKGVVENLVRGWKEKKSPYPASQIPLTITKGRMYEVLRGSDAAIVTSGTATLETALMGVPMVIIYRLSFLTSLVARMFVKVDYIGLPNIVAGKGIVPELIQEDIKPETIARYILEFMNNSVVRNHITTGLREVKERLGSGNASQRAAEEIYKVMTMRNYELGITN